ncbi:MAG: hypothetical protein LBH24_04640 [Clostridiales bacterium]|jgi:uncharacterized coiled-coil protein SlyX|nr:hypothetical protein [Clostridiales bacterium]
MDIIELVDELYDELNGKKGLFNKRVDLTRCAELIEVVRDSLPAALSEAKTVIAKRESIYKNADSVAKNIIKEAEERAAHKSDTSEVLKLANRESKLVVDRTYRQCDLLVQKTKEHLDSMFSDVETFMEETLDMIHKNRDELRNASIGNLKD